MSRKSSRNHLWELANYTHNVFFNDGKQRQYPLFEGCFCSQVTHI